MTDKRIEQHPAPLFEPTDQRIAEIRLWAENDADIMKHDPRRDILFLLQRLEQVTAERDKAKEDGDESAVMLSALNDEHFALQQKLEAAEATIASLSTSLSEVLALFGDIGTLKAITPDEAAHVRKTSLLRPATVADVYRWHASLPSSAVSRTAERQTP